jgi:hypothetical protein
MTSMTDIRRVRKYTAMKYKRSMAETQLVFKGKRLCDCKTIKELRAETDSSDVEIEVEFIRD